MSVPLITLTTDFGEDSPYVAAMKGVILTVNSEARLIDLTHQIPPQNLWHAAFFLKHSLPHFPPGTLHVIVVDPGVGTEREMLYVEARGQCLLVPDNGCWTLFANQQETTMVRVLAESRYWRSPVSATFQGRDILAPVAGWLSRGLAPESIGPTTAEWVRLRVPEPEVRGDGIHGEVVFVDHFGNLITNIPGEKLAALKGRNIRVLVGSSEVDVFARTYGETTPGTLLALISSSGMLEIALNQGNAADRLGAAFGTPVGISLRLLLPADGNKP